MSWLVFVFMNFYWNIVSLQYSVKLIFVCFLKLKSDTVLNKGRNHWILILQVLISLFLAALSIMWGLKFPDQGLNLYPLQ